MLGRKVARHMLKTILGASWLTSASLFGTHAWMLAQNAPPSPIISEQTLFSWGVVAGLVASTWWIKGRFDRGEYKVKELERRLEQGDQQFRDLMKSLRELPCVRPRSSAEVLAIHHAMDDEADRQADRQEKRHPHAEP
jgi:hypothetical protein